MSNDTLTHAPTDRRSAAAAGLLERHEGRERQQAFAGTIRAERVQKEGKEFVLLDGYATVFNTLYTMWDFFGEYQEQVASTACDVTLAKNPDVAYLLNHGGMTMARTTAGTLTLTNDETGLHSLASVNPKRNDVNDLVIAVDDEAITEMSFAFRIINGRWNEDFTIYTITEVDLDRGDVSAVNYGANPFTSISARAKQALDAIDHLEGAPLRAVAERAQARLAARSEEPEAGDQLEATPTGRSAATLRILADLADDGLYSA